jgi:hypothetical protein
MSSVHLARGIFERRTIYPIEIRHDIAMSKGVI